MCRSPSALGFWVLWLGSSGALEGGYTQDDEQHHDAAGLIRGMDLNQWDVVSSIPAHWFGYMWDARLGRSGR